MSNCPTCGHAVPDSKEFSGVAGAVAPITSMSESLTALVDDVIESTGYSGRSVH